MKDFEVTIEETLTQTFKVKANSLTEACEIASEKYNNGEFVLEPGELESKEMMARDAETEEETNWFEF